MGFDVGDRVDISFLDDFDGKVIKAGWVEGLVPAERTKSGKAQVTHQLFLYVQPADAEQKSQPSWYGMGGKEYIFGGTTEKVMVGEKELVLYAEIVDGPKLSNQSRCGQLLNKLEELGCKITGSKAAAFVGLDAHWKREAYKQEGKDGKTGASSDREALMPTALIAGGTSPGAAGPAGAGGDAGSDEEAADIVAAMIDGKKDSDVPKLIKEDRIKALGLEKSSALYKMIDKLVAGGKLVRSDKGVYQAKE